MPRCRFKSQAFVLLAVCLALWGCPEVSGITDPGLSSGDDFGGGSVGGQTIRPSATPTSGATAAPTATPTTTPAPTPTASAGSKPLLKSVQLLNPIAQMWLLEAADDVPPDSIPSTYSFQAEVATLFGSDSSTSSAVVWTSSHPSILAIDRNTGSASTAIAQGLFEVTITAATHNAGAIDPSTKSTSIRLTVGNSGTLYLTIE